VQCKYVERASPTKDSYDSITGTLNLIQESSYDWDGETQRMLELSVAGDDGQFYILRGKMYSKIMMDYLNRIASIDDLKQNICFKPYRQSANGYNEIRGGIRLGKDMEIADYKYPDMSNVWPTEGRMKLLLKEVRAKLTKVLNEMAVEN